VGDLKLLHAPAELSTGIGSFYMRREALPAIVARCDCLACREEQQHQTYFQREPT
jgi:hypothetical protein